MQEEDCGCFGTTRREFVKSAAIVGVATVGMGLLYTIEPARADNDMTCDVLYEACLRNNCSSLTGPRAYLCKGRCYADWVACLAGNTLRHMYAAIEEGTGWIRSHPGVAAGTVLVIGGFTLLVIATGGGALAVTFA